MADAGPDSQQPDPAVDEHGAEAGRARLIRDALERVLASPDFSASPRLAAFLRFVVESTLDGRAEEIKGYTIAVEALGRPTSFDPQADPIVRVEATRLRRALERYYTALGTDDAIVIDIPKGGYVPQFLPRVEPAPERPAEPEETALPANVVPALVRPRSSRRRIGVGLGLAVVALSVIGGAAFLATRQERQEAAVRASAADRVRLPVLEVRPLATAGTGTPDAADLRAIEERMRDAFARFDFVEVKAAGSGTPESALSDACGGSQARSVFSLSGLAEGRADGTFSLVARLTDRCSGSIVWSAALDGLARNAALVESERRIVRDIAAAIMESYGVIPVQARAQALAKAPNSGFGCIAGAFAVQRGEAGKRTANVKACLTELTTQNPDFALGHAVRAASQLYVTLHDDTPTPSNGEMEEILNGAERAAELAPASAYAARTLAMVQLFAGEPGDAVATAEKAIQLNPLDFDVAATAAIVFIGAGRVVEGEALLLHARREGAVRTALQDAFLALSAFLRDDLFAAQALVPQLTLHSAIENKLALALCLHTLGRVGDEREVVSALVHLMPDGAEGVRRLLQRLLPSEAQAQKALAALESAGLSREAVAGKPPRG